MKTKSLFALVLFVLTINVSSAQIRDSLLYVTGIQLQKESIQKFLDGPKFTAFTVSKRGVLRPANGYKMMLNQKKGFVAIVPKEETVPQSFRIDGYEEIELPGGHIVACFCMAGYDNCRFEKDPNPQTPNRFQCTGSCKCGVGVIFAPDDGPAQYETPGGNWFNF